jgi:hypothetical protein
MSDSSIPPDSEDIFPLDESILGDITTADAGPVSGDDALFGTMTYDDSGELAPETPRDSTGFEESTIIIGDGSCDVCGAPTFRPPGLTPSGRKKRAPKYCDLHTPNAKVSTARPSVKGMESQLQRVQDELADDLRLLGTMAGPLLPVTGFYVFEHADPFTIAILKLAKNNTRVLRVLHRMAQVAPVYTVAETIAGTAYAIQVDTKGADPHNTVAHRLGVSRAYDAVHPDVTTNGNGAGNVPFSGPPRYQQNGAGVQ